MRDGQVVERPLDAPLPDVLDVLEDRTHPDYARAVEALVDAARQVPAVDMSAHAAALLRMRRMEEALVESEASLRAMFDYAPAGMALVTPSLIVTTRPGR